eukprot:PhF_6_TR5551/c0_g1_i1/m.7923
MFTTVARIVIGIVILSQSLNRVTQATKDPPCPAYPIPVPLPNPTEALATAISTIDARLTKKSAKYPGMIVGLGYGVSGVFWEKGYGKRNYSDPTNNAPPTLDNVVRIASISKVFTCILLFKLRDEGIVASLDDPVTKYLPTFSVLSNRPTRRSITLRELASHTSGLQRESPCPPAGDCVPLSHNQILRNIANTYTLYSPYRKFHYSNLGIGVLGHALTAAANATSFEELLTQKVLHPLGITDGNFSCCTPSQAANVAVGKSSIDGKPVRMPTLGWGNPDGGLIMSGRDVLRMVQNLPSYFGDEGTWNEFTDAVTVLEDGLSAVGTPWEMRRVGNYWAKGKAGALDGYRTEMMTIPSLSLSCFIAVLQSEVVDPYEYTMEILSDVIPVLEAALWSIQPPYVLPSNHTNALGNFSYDTYIYVENGVMYIDGQGQHLNLTFVSEQRYRARVVADPMPGCRWLEDGTNDEFVTFAPDWKSFAFMGNMFFRV